MIASRIKKENYEIALVNFYGLEGGIIRVNDIAMYPKMSSAWGDDAMVYHGEDFKADVSFTLQDIWTLNPDLLNRTKRWIPIVPIDHDPPPAGIVDRLRQAYRIITYSKFGFDRLQKMGFHTTYIQHAVDTNVLKPMDNREELKKKFGIKPNLYLFGMVAANKDNPPRKSFQEAIDAFAIFHEKYPDSAMYFHGFLNQQGGFPIDFYWQFKGLPKDKMFYLQPYDVMFHVGRNEMAQIYNCFDCLLAPSTNEGFGVPIVEAQSCGVPAIVNNFTAMPELVKDRTTGRICQLAYKRLSPLNSYIGIPDVNSLVECMFDIYKKDKQKMSEECRKWVLEEYDMDKVYNEKWSPFLKQLEKEVYPSNT